MTGDGRCPAFLSVPSSPFPKDALLQQHIFGKWLGKSLVNSRKTSASLLLHLRSTAKRVTCCSEVYLWNLHTDLILPYGSSFHPAPKYHDHRSQGRSSAGSFREGKKHLAEGKVLWSDPKDERSSIKTRKTEGSSREIMSRILLRITAWRRAYTR